MGKVLKWQERYLAWADNQPRAELIEELMYLAVDEFDGCGRSQWKIKECRKRLILPPERQERSAPL